MKVMEWSRKSEETLTSCMDEMRQTLGHLEPLSRAMRARNECGNTRLRRLTTTRTFTCYPSVSRHCWVSCASCLSWLSRCHWCRTSHRSVSPRTRNSKYKVLLDVAVRLCPVIVNSNCIPNSGIFHIAKTCLLMCCLHKAWNGTVFQVEGRDASRVMSSQRPGARRLRRRRTRHDDFGR